MINKNINYNEWDKIESYRKQIKKDNPQLKSMERKMFYIDQEGIERCAKCGINEKSISCHECIMGL